MAYPVHGCPKSNVSDIILKQLYVGTHSDRLGLAKEEVSSQTSGRSIVFDYPESKGRLFRETRSRLPYKSQCMFQSMLIMFFEAGPTMCPKIRTYRRCVHVLTSSTPCYQQSHVESYAEAH